jgi:phosphoenolpyruvate---glycerone phosphotransferase subunit DhaM
MVGLVLVSHSEQLAAGLRDMVVTLAPGEVTVEAAGGTDDGRFGTSYQRIEAAISKADRGAGVVVLADMGPAGGGRRRGRRPGGHRRRARRRVGCGGRGP